jgi:hypothetical protein
MAVFAPGEEPGLPDCFRFAGKSRTRREWVSRIAGRFQGVASFGSGYEEFFDPHSDANIK